MKELTSVKELIERGPVKIRLGINLNQALNDFQKLGYNSLKISNALDELQNHGVKEVLKVDVPNLRIQIFEKDFDELVTIGYTPKVRDNLGVVLLGEVEIVSALPPSKLKEYSKLVSPFHFWFSELSANSLEKFKKCLEKAPVKSLEHHMYNDDFTKWFENEFKNKEIVEKLKKLKEEHWEGEDLREKLIKLLKNY